MVMGGNAGLRRRVLETVGPYSVDLGRTPGGRLLSCEDDDMFARLLSSGAIGFYRPDLIIHHYVPAERLTKRYYRRWCFWRGVSLGLLDRKRPAPVRYLLGVPRFMVGIAVRGTIETVRGLFGPHDPARTFKNELAWWDLAGFVYGKHGSRIDPYITAIARRFSRRAGGDRQVRPRQELAVGEGSGRVASSSRSGVRPRGSPPQGTVRDRRAHRPQGGAQRQTSRPAAVRARPTAAPS